MAKKKTKKKVVAKKTTKRKCGFCRKRGHNRRTCPDTGWT